MRLACAEIRGLFLAAAASQLNCAATDLSMMDGAVCRDGKTTGQDYWSLANNVDLTSVRDGQLRHQSGRTITALSAQERGPRRPRGQSVRRRRFSSTT